MYKVKGPQSHGLPINREIWAYKDLRKNKESYRDAERVGFKKKYHPPTEQGPRARRSSRVVGNNDVRSEVDNFYLVLCVSWSSMVEGYCKGERIGDARNLFDIVPERNVVTWTAMIDGYMRLESFKYGFELLFKGGWDDVVRLIGFLFFF